MRVTARDSPAATSMKTARSYRPAVSARVPKNAPVAAEAVKAPRQQTVVAVRQGPAVSSPGDRLASIAR